MPWSQIQGSLGQPPISNTCNLLALFSKTQECTLAYAQVAHVIRDALDGVWCAVSLVQRRSGQCRPSWDLRSLTSFGENGRAVCKTLSTAVTLSSTPSEVPSCCDSSFALAAHLDPGSNALFTQATQWSSKSSMWQHPRPTPNFSICTSGEGAQGENRGQHNLVEKKANPWWALSQVHAGGKI